MNPEINFEMQSQTKSVRRYPVFYSESKTINDTWLNSTINADSIDILYKKIIDNLDDIEQMYCKKKYEKINKLLIGCETFVQWYQYTNKQQLQYCLLMYAIKHINMQILEIVMDENDDDIPGLIIDLDMKITNHNISHKILNFVKLTNEFVDYIFGHIEIDTQCLDILLKKGINIDSRHLLSIIRSNNIDVIKYLMKENYDIQYLYDNANFIEVYGYFSEVNICTLKFLYENIDLKKNIEPLYYAIIIGHNFKAVEFVVELFCELDLNKGLDQASIVNDCEIMKYLLQKGADINKLTYHSGYKIETIKFLIENGYNSSCISFDVRKYFCNDLNLENTKYLLQNGSNIDSVFTSQFENKVFKIDFNSISGNFHYLISPLEHTVAKGKLSHIEFLVENYFESLYPELDRLFVVACANGQIEMAKYLHQLGATPNNISIIFSCFFGQINIVNYLLDIGLLFDDVKSVNLFSILFHTKMSLMLSLDYENLLTNHNLTDILRNDIYNCEPNYNNYQSIVRLLIKYNVGVQDFDYKKEVTNGLLELDIIKYFFDSIKDLNDKTARNDTLLEMCIRFCKYEVAEFLLENGANTEIAENYRNSLNTVRELAPMLKLFEEYGYEKINII